MGVDSNTIFILQKKAVRAIASAECNNQINQIVANDILDQILYLLLVNTCSGQYNF